MKVQTTKKLFFFIIMMMFSFSFINAQPCNGNKIRVYKCVGPLGHNCVSKCVSPNQIPLGWSIYPCDCGRSRIENKKAEKGLFTLAISTGPILGASFFNHLPEKSQLDARLVSTLANKNFKIGKNEWVWNTEEVNEGIYFLQFLSTEKMYTKKVIVTE